MVALEEEFLAGSSGSRTAPSNIAAGDLGAPAVEEDRPRGLVPVAGAVPRGDVVLEHDRLPGAAARDPLALGEHGLEPLHTLNGTVVTDRAVLAILENFQGDVPDVLQQYGAPSRNRGLKFPRPGGSRGAPQT